MLKRACVSELVRAQRLLRQLRLRRRANRQLTADRPDDQRERRGHERRERRRQNRRQPAQILERDDVRLEVVVHDRRRPERAVVREPNRVLGQNPEVRRQSRREERVAEVAELVDTAADVEADPIEEDFVLDVGAELVAILRLRRQRDVEVVAPDVAADRQHLAGADRKRIAGLEVEGLRGQRHLQRLAGCRIREEQVRCFGVEPVDEEIHLQRVA